MLLIHTSNQVEDLISGFGLPQGFHKRILSQVSCRIVECTQVRAWLIRWRNQQEKDVNRFLVK
jgi:hypothetical protein